MVKTVQPFNFMELNKVPSSLIFANIFHIYNELFLKISALDIYRGASKDKKEAFLNVLRLLAQHNNQLSRRPEIAYQRKKILSEIFGNEAIDTLFVVSSKSLSNAPPENRLKSDSSPLPFSQSGRKPKPPQLHIPRSRSEFFSDAHLPQLKELFSPKRDEHPLPTRAEVFLPKIPVMGTDQAKRRTSDTFHGLSKKVQRSEEEKTSSTKQFFATPSRHERKMNPVIGEASSKRPPRSRSAFLAGSHSSRMKTQAYTEQASLGNRESQSERTAGAKVTSTFVYGKEL